MIQTVNRLQLGHVASRLHRHERPIPRDHHGHTLLAHQQLAPTDFHQIAQPTTQLKELGVIAHHNDAVDGVNDLQWTQVQACGAVLNNKVASQALAVLGTVTISCMQATMLASISKLASKAG